MIRAVTMAVFVATALAVIPVAVQAAPAAPPEMSGSPASTLVRDGCGAGWHAQSWRDRWGNWRRRCVPNRW